MKLIKLIPVIIVILGTIQAWIMSWVEYLDHGNSHMVLILSTGIAGIISGVIIYKSFVNVNKE